MARMTPPSGMDMMEKIEWYKKIKGDEKSLKALNKAKNSGMAPTEIDYKSGGEVPSVNAQERSVQSYAMGGPIDNMNPVNPNEMRNPMNPPNPNQMMNPANPPKMAGPQQNNDSLMGNRPQGYSWMEDLVPREMADGRMAKGGKVKKK